MAYRGIMLDGIPNFAYAIGYTNASWTLKIGLTCEYFVRLLKHMRRHGHDSVEPRLDAQVGTRPLLDFQSGYVQRAIAELPRQGERSPWRVSMNYYADARTLRWSPIRDRRLRFGRRGEAPAPTSNTGVAAGRSKPAPRPPGREGWRRRADLAGSVSRAPARAGARLARNAAQPADCDRRTPVSAPVTDAAAPARRRGSRSAQPPAHPTPPRRRGGRSR